MTHFAFMNNLEAKKMLCNRFVLAQKATGLNKKAFAECVGLTPSQFTNIARYRNPPSREAVARACAEFGFTTDFFYLGQRAGMHDPEMSEKIRKAQTKLGLLG